jgi:hypothetical protein
MERRRGAGPTTEQSAATPRDDERVEGPQAYSMAFSMAFSMAYLTADSMEDLSEVSMEDSMEDRRVRV